MSETKLCPFRRSIADKSVFEPCCGTACMAYCEYEATVGPYNVQSKLTAVPCCKLMQPVPYYAAFNGPL